MNSRLRQLIDRLETERSLALTDYVYLIENRTDEAAAYLAAKADQARRRVYGNAIYIRGLIEVGNRCRNDCLYCGIRRGNARCDRYRLTREQILGCCEEGYALGFRTFVLQGGEDPWFSAAAVCELVGAIKARYPDCAVTLSLGEYPKEAYQAMFAAGADRYLLRHETADRAHYEKLHPAGQSFARRMRCLADLKQIGYQTGCGFMVGSPYQTAQTLAKDLKFVEQFSPAMCGIGPFIPHGDTPFGDRPAGSVELTVYLLSVLRLMQPNLLLPATTALGSLHPEGREKGILAGANVVMPNLSPPAQRRKYALYRGKRYTGEESAQGLAALRAHMQDLGYEVVTVRGDIIINTLTESEH